jgi:hypothetical protein
LNIDKDIYKQLTTPESSIQNGKADNLRTFCLVVKITTKWHPG